MNKKDLRIQLNLLMASRDATEFEIARVLHKIKLLASLSKLNDEDIVDETTTEPNIV